VPASQPRTSGGGNWSFMQEKILYVSPAKVKMEAELRAKARNPEAAVELTPEQLGKNWMAAAKS
jgi:hypothetical protein